MRRNNGNVSVEKRNLIDGNPVFVSLLFNLFMKHWKAKPMHRRLITILTGMTADMVGS